MTIIQWWKFLQTVINQIFSLYLTSVRYVAANFWWGFKIINFIVFFKKIIIVHFKAGADEKKHSS